MLNTAVDYLWQDGSTLPNYTVTSAGVYSLKASNKCGTLTSSIKITTGVCKLIMPSAFTPNGDGFNDLFKVKYPFPVQRFDMVVYNRWGQKIFETEDITQGWDGTLNGQLQPPGAYIWIISLIDDQSVSQAAHGTVVLIR